MARRAWGRVPFVTTLIVAIVLALGGLGWAASQPLRLTQGDVLLRGTTIDGVAVGGLRADEASAAVAAGRAGDLDLVVTLRWPGGEGTATLGELGSAIDASGVVEEALAARADMSWSELAQIRWTGEQSTWTGTAGWRHDPVRITRYLRNLARDVVRRPAAASYDWSSSEMTVAREQAGHRLDVAAATAAVVEALDTGRYEIDLPVVRLAPVASRDDLEPLLFVDQTARELRLYDRGRMIRRWPVAIGAPGYPTPVGEYHVTEKRYLPTWVNPSPNGWGRDMPRAIGPGRNNPLGLRALNWSAPGAIRFHGTTNLRSIGTAASKGCVRLTNADVIELYDLIEVGTRIVSVRGPVR